MDTAQWPQEILVVTNNTCPKPASASASASGGVDQRKPRPQKEQALNCPRCRSTNTKFCYYNNYSLTQPRYFCKTCRRYWTEGGSLRNIPVGGGSRKNKRPPSSSCPSSEPPPHKNIKLPDQDLNLGYRNNISQLVQQNHNNKNGSTVSASSPPCTSNTTVSASSQQPHDHFSAMELLNNGITSSGSRGLHSNFMHVPVPAPHPDPNTVFTCGFPIQDFKPGLNFSLDGIGSTAGFASLHHQETSDDAGRLLFPFEDLKRVSSAAATTTTTLMDHASDKEQERDHSNGYWTGMLGGGGGGGPW